MKRSHLTFALICLFILGALFISGCGTTENEEKNHTSTPKEVARTGDIFKVGNLSFLLVNVVLLKWAPLRWSYLNDIERYTLFWFFNVTNEGDAIENVSDCGILLFENGTQYQLDVYESASGFLEYRREGECNDYSLVPGAKEEIYSTFYFTNSSEYISTSRWPTTGPTVVWKEVPGLKITYFSQQSAGLVKYEVYKYEIINLSE